MRDVNSKRLIKAGLRRLWFVLSVIWLAAVTWIVLDDSGKHFYDWLKAGVLPVIVLYGVFAGATWIIEGFARVDR